jgi:tetratricopeptide (TPR) repeat protein
MMMKKYFKKERKIMPSPIDKYHSLGLYYLKMGEYNKAIEFFKKVLIVDPVHTDSKEKIRLLNKKINNKNMKNINLENKIFSENKILSSVSKYSSQEYNESSSVDVNSLQDIHRPTKKNEDIPLPHDIYIEKIQAIVIVMEKYYAKYGTVVPIDTYEFSIVNIINRRSDIFYKCTPKNIVLVKWIIDKIKEMFSKSHNDDLLFSNIYQQLRVFFRHISINRQNLKKLLKTDKRISAKAFSKIIGKYMPIYEKIA